MRDDEFFDSMIEQERFQELRKHLKKGLFVNGLIMIVGIPLLSYLAVINKRDDLAGWVVTICILAAVFGNGIFGNIRKLKLVDIREREAEDRRAQLALERQLAEKPENLLERLCSLLPDDCKVELLPEQDVDTLTSVYLDAKEDGDRNGYVPVIVQMDSNLMENIEDNHESEFEPVPDGKAYLDDIVDDIRSSWSESEWEEVIGARENAEEDVLDGMDGPDFFWGRFALVRVPVQDVSDVFAKIPMGDWNDCPDPEEHQAVARYWNGKYGAVPCFVSSDIIMYYVNKPVGDQAFELAMEQMGYCEDIIFQGVGDVWSLAMRLEKSTFWYFWWD